MGNLPGKLHTSAKAAAVDNTWDIWDHDSAGREGRMNNLGEGIAS